MWRVVVPRSVVRALARFPSHDRERIEGAIEAMIGNPFGGDFKKLRAKSYRLRVGSYRVLYEIDQENHIVENP
jgi:mRNA-degrading endonuclease RelE of RelBE toxin-antitoxin system